MIAEAAPDSATPLVLAIDGPAGAGKSTVARRAASRLGWAWLDSGAMYRAVTLIALERGIEPTDADRLAALAADLALTLGRDGTVTVAGRDVSRAIRTPEVTEAVSLVAAIPRVREVMVAHQRRFARENGAIVAEGRDIGTVVFPDARVKIWLDADPVERARRRASERSPGAAVGGAELAATQERMARRDRLDSTRAVAPLRPAPGAVRIDTTPMTPDEAVEAVLSTVHSALST